MTPAPYQIDVSSRYGAPMGRPSHFPGAEDFARCVSVDAVPLPDGYDPGGAYWGPRPPGSNLFCVYPSTGQGGALYLDATSLGEAIEQARATLPLATFPDAPEPVTLHGLKEQFRVTVDSGDPWGSVMAWRFAICDYLTFETQTGAPSDWEYKAGHGGPDVESFEYQTLLELQPDPRSLEAFGNLLKRAAEILDARGYAY